jgi:hypothetical protein
MLQVIVEAHLTPYPPGALQDLYRYMEHLDKAEELVYTRAS